MNISTSLNVFDASIPPEIQVKRCKQSGFEALDLAYCDYQHIWLTKSWDEEERWAHRFREAAEQYGIPFSQMHGPMHGSAYTKMMMGLDVESFLTLAKRSMLTASILGADWVVFHPTIVSYQKAFTLEESYKFNVDFYSRLIPVMEELGVGIALENLFAKYPGMEYDATTTEQLVELVDRFNHPLVGICWDTGHGHIASHDQYMAITQLGTRLKALHIQDNDGKNDQHLLPYHGSIDWEKVHMALLEIEYQGDFTYEVHHAVRKVPDSLRDPLLHYSAQLAKSIIGRPML